MPLVSRFCGQSGRLLLQNGKNLRPVATIGQQPTRPADLHRQEGRTRLGCLSDGSFCLFVAALDFVVAPAALSNCRNPVVQSTRKFRVKADFRLDVFSATSRARQRS
jgi:hypothetical protein